MAGDIYAIIIPSVFMFLGGYTITLSYLVG